MAELRERLRILDEASVPDQWSEIEGRLSKYPPHMEPGPWRRVAAATVAIAIAMAGTVFAVDALTPERDPEASLDPRTWPVHEVHQLDLTFRYPSDWHVQPFEEMVGHAGFTGAVVSNVDHTFRHPDLGEGAATSHWDLRSLPDDTVAISIERVSALMVETNEPDTSRPLRLDAAHAQQAGGRYVPSAWGRRWLPFVLGGFHNTLQIATGPEASEHDLEVARVIVASIEPALTLSENGDIGLELGGDIFVVDPQRGTRKNLTRTDAFTESQPAWSPNGESIAFVGCADCVDTDLFVMRADGSGRERVTSGPDVDLNPAWSPDGTQLVFQRGDGQSARLWLISLATGRADVLPPLDLYGFNGVPSWSPDGQLIAFEVADSSQRRIATIRVDGSGARILTDEGLQASSPAWSPNGQRIAFSVFDDQGRPAVFVMGATGTSPTRVARGGIFTWAPDGASIAVVRDSSSRPGASEIVLISLNGSNDRDVPGTLTVESDGYARSLTWQPLPQ